MNLTRILPPLLLIIGLRLVAVPAAELAWAQKPAQPSAKAA